MRCLFLYIVVICGLLIPILTGCTAMKAAASIVNPAQISATANVGDNRQTAELNKQKAVTFDEVDADTANINTNVKQNAITKGGSVRLIA